MKKDELSQKTVAELTALTKELGIVVKGRRKADIIAGILKAGKKAASRSTKKAPAKPAKKTAAPVRKMPARAAGRAPEKRKEPERKVAAKKAPPAARPKAIEPAQSFKKKDLAEKTVAGLRAMAGELDIVVKGRRKDDIIVEIQKAARRLRVKAPGVIRKARKAPPKKAARPAAKEEAKVPPREKTKPKPETISRPRRRVEGEALSIAAKRVAVKPTPEGAKPVEERPVSVPKAPEVPHRPAPPGQVEERPFARPREYYETGAIVPSAPELRKVPAEAGIADRLTAIVVDHRQIFVSWQLREDAHREGFPAIRVYDATGIAFSAKRAGSFFDLLLQASSGSAYIEVVPGRELFVALGVMTPGGVFSTVKTTGRLFVPRERAPEGKAILPDEYFRFRPPHY